jgi:hypothetical protein
VALHAAEQLPFGAYKLFDDVVLGGRSVSQTFERPDRGSV